MLDTNTIQKNLTSHIADAGLHILEGSASVKELNSLAFYANQPNVKNILEVGFNAGFSSYTFLEANQNANLVSFDLGEHKYVTPAKEYIDQKFSNRHTLIIGDSTKTIPQYAQETGQTFDLIFIDGGHSFEIALTDIKNCRNLAHKETIVIIDDLVPWLPWGIGPYRAWKKAHKLGLVQEYDRNSDGFIFPRRTWAVGRYLL